MRQVVQLLSVQVKHGSIVSVNVAVEVRDAGRLIGSLWASVESAARLLSVTGRIVVCANALGQTVSLLCMMCIRKELRISY